LTPDVVLLEDGFTDVTASNILAVVDDEAPSSRLVFFTATVTCGDLARALATGACGAISMNAKPEALVQSLRLEKPGSYLASVGNKASFGNNVLAVLTANERTIMDLVAEGLSDSEIARLLGVSLEIVRIHIDHARQKLGITSRTELAALALSRRYGAMSILTAAILAALDDSPGHAATESFTVMAENGCPEVITIKIGRKEAVSGGIPTRGASKDRVGASTGALSPTSKIVDPAGEIAASLFAQATINAQRPGSSSYSIFMVAAFVALIYELDGANHATQAFDFGDEIGTSSTAHDVNGIASVPNAFANFIGPAESDGAFAFGFAQGDTIAAYGSEPYVGNPHVAHGGSDRESAVPQGSGTIDVVAVTTNEASQREATQAGRDDRSVQGRSQSDLRPSDNSSEAAEHDVLGNGSNHGQSQQALHESDNSSGAAKGHAKHETAGEDSKRAGDLKAFENGSAAEKQHAHHPQAGDLDTDNPQRELPMASANVANHAHSASKIDTADKNGPSSLDSDPVKSSVGTDLGDSFHFKNGADNTSSDVYDLQQLSQGSGKTYGDGQHAVARETPEPVQDADGSDISNAHHNHSHVNLHAVHDLIV